jgi:hypothetical protein
MSSNIVGSGNTGSSIALWRLYLGLTVALTSLTFLGWYGVQAWEKWSHKRKEAEKDATAWSDHQGEV